MPEITGWPRRGSALLRALELRRGHVEPRSARKATSTTSSGGLECLGKLCRSDRATKRGASQCPMGSRESAVVLPLQFPHAAPQAVAQQLGTA
jgi:hypothetical protein